VAETNSDWPSINLKWKSGWKSQYKNQLSWFERIASSECVRTEFTTVKLTSKDVPQVIVTSADAICYGHSERRNNVLQQVGGKWTQLAELTGVLDVGSVVTHGYRELVLGGPGYCGNEVYRWTGRTYTYVCNAPGDMDAELRRACTAAPSRIRWCKPGHEIRP
jgi:hypothetical protein